MRRRVGINSAGRPVVIQARDVDALALIGTCRYVTAEQCARALSWSLDRCSRRLKLLAEADYLRVTATGSRSPRLYSVGAAGLATLRHALPDTAARIRLPGAIRLAGVAHHLAIVDARLYVVALANTLQVGSKCRKTRDCATLRIAQSDVLQHVPHCEFQSFASGAAVGKSLGLESLRLEPDAVATFSLSDNALFHTAIEVDASSESGRIIAGKVERYAEAISRGFLHEIWWIVLGGIRRRDALVRQAVLGHLAAYCRVFDIGQIRRLPVEPPPALLSAALPSGASCEEDGQRDAAIEIANPESGAKRRAAP